MRKNENIFFTSVLESQASGIPVVSRYNGNIKNYVYNDETGYITNEDNIFSNKVINILSDNSLFLRLSKNAQLNKKVKSWEIVVEKFEKKINANIIHR